MDFVGGVLNDGHQLLRQAYVSALSRQNMRYIFDVVFAVGCTHEGFQF